MTVGERLPFETRRPVTPRQILVATDFSEIAGHALRVAAGNAARLTAIGRPLDDASDPELDTELKHCVICAGPTDDLVCATCRARIRGQAVERKLREERAGR